MKMEIVHEKPWPNGFLTKLTVGELQILLGTHLLLLACQSSSILNNWKEFSKLLSSSETNPWFIICWHTHYSSFLSWNFSKTEDKEICNHLSICWEYLECFREILCLFCLQNTLIHLADITDDMIDCNSHADSSTNWLFHKKADNEFWKWCSLRSRILCCF